MCEMTIEELNALDDETRKFILRINGLLTDVDEGNRDDELQEEPDVMITRRDEGEEIPEDLEVALS